MSISLQALLEAGCHFGHKAEKWHPKASPYIFTKKDGIHIIDLAQTKAQLENAMAFIESERKEGREILFVATKRQAKETVRELAEKAGAPYLTYRWIGGFLTNWDSVKKNIDRINTLEEDERATGWKRYPKHERVRLGRYLNRIKQYYVGVQKLSRMPDCIVIVDVRKEKSAVKEAARVGIPSVAIVDTNSDPTSVTYPVPANDDAVGSIRVIMEFLTESYAKGKAAFEKGVEKAKQEAEALKSANAVKGDKPDTKTEAVTAKAQPSLTENAADKAKPAAAAANVPAKAAAAKPVPKAPVKAGKKAESAKGKAAAKSGTSPKTKEGKAKK